MNPGTDQAKGALNPARRFERWGFWLQILVGVLFLSVVIVSKLYNYRNPGIRDADEGDARGVQEQIVALSATLVTVAIFVTGIYFRLRARELRNERRSAT